MTSRIGIAALVLALAAPGPALAADDKACQTARKKVEREQRSLAAANDLAARDRQARETCVSRTACARYDAAIADTERRTTRIESRLSRFGAELASACG